jgi:hypothetical protein
MTGSDKYVDENYKLNKMFSFLVVYYWVLIYIKEASYVMLTLPIGLFVGYMLLIYIKNFSSSNGLSFILLFVIFSVYLSFIRLDFTSLIAVSLFGLTIFFIDHFKLSVALNLLNSLFIISVLLSIPLYYSGYSQYGFIPGDGGFSNDAFLSGRISMFPNVTVSIYFSFIILLINYFFNENNFQKIVIFIFSFYFIYFGISRTVMIGLAFILLFSGIFKLYPLYKNWFYQLFLPFVLIFIPILSVFFIEDIISFLVSLNSDFISQYFFRGHSSVDKILEDIARTNIWAEHLRLFLEHPWGLTSAEITRYVDPALHLSDGGGSESFLTRILMRYGFGAFFLYLFLMSLLIRSLYEKNHYLYLFVYLFIFIGVTYGSFFVAYNMLFLVFMSSLNYRKKF